MNIETLSNKKPVEEVIAYIRARAQSSNMNWMEIAAELSQAKNMYGATDKSYKEILRATKFSESKANKLTGIANSDRLKKYADKLSLVDSWGTLYAIHALNETNFQTLRDSLTLDDPNSDPVFISQSEVDRVRREKRQSFSMKKFAIINIDEEALKGGIISSDGLERLNSLLDQIEAITTHIAVSKTGIDDKDTANFMKRLDEKKTLVAREVYLNRLQAIQKRHKKQKGVTSEQHEQLCFGLSKPELLAEFNADPRAAFKRFGFEYDGAKFYEKAQARLSEEADKIAQKVWDRLSKSENGQNSAVALAA